MNAIASPIFYPVTHGPKPCYISLHLISCNNITLSSCNQSSILNCFRNFDSVSSDMNKETLLIFLDMFRINTMTKTGTE